MTNKIENHCTSSNKICTRCEQRKPLESFGNAGRGDGRLRSYCKDCAKEYSKTPKALAAAKARKDFYNANRRIKYDPVSAKYQKILKNYNVTQEQYDQMFMAQGGLCAICNEATALVVDHDHSCCSSAARSCGKCVRGLLCNNCNNGLGRFQDKENRLRNALNYVIAAKARGYM